MADLMEMAKELGRALQQDERYLSFRAAAETNDNDSVLQDLIASFTVKRRDLEREQSSERPDEDRINALEAEAKALYGEIMSNPSMAAYQGARAAFEQLLDGINRVIAMSAAGKDPDSFDLTAAASCSGDCSACGGCH
jgi:cell fate (sporulation/competence/biofilm development) regulator YlbF (YheA/YmcA/DUF963 family)